MGTKTRHTFPVKPTVQRSSEKHTGPCQRKGRQQRLQNPEGQLSLIQRAMTAQTADQRHRYNRNIAQARKSQSRKEQVMNTGLQRFVREENFQKQQRERERERAPSSRSLSKHHSATRETGNWRQYLPLWLTHRFHKDLVQSKEL